MHGAPSPPSTVRGAVGNRPGDQLLDAQRLCSEARRPTDRLYAAIARIGDLYCYLVYGFLVLPLIAIVPLSFSSDSYLNYPLPGFSSHWYRELIVDPNWALALKNSLLIGVAAMIIATVLGVLAAFGLRARSLRFSAVMNLVFLLPMIVPVIIYAVSVYVQFSGWGLVGSYVGLILTHAVLAAPFAVITVSAALRNFDWNLVRAAYSHGASPVQTFFMVILPNILPGVVSGALFAFIVSFDEVVVTLFIASPGQKTLPLQLFGSIRDEITPVITSASVVMIFISAGTMTLIEYFRRRANNSTQHL